jgi:hypothetical protein
MYETASQWREGDCTNMAFTYVGLIRCISLLAVLLTVSCKSRQAANASPDPVQVADSRIDEMVREMETHPDGTARQRHTIKSIREALTKLKGKSVANFGEPVLIVAEVSGIPAAKDALSLKIHYVDPAWDATGLYVLEPQGHERRFDNSITWSADERDYYRSNALRDIAYPVIVDEKSASAWVGIRNVSPALKFDSNALRAGIKVGFITKSGGRTPAVDVFFSPETQKSSWGFYPFEEQAKESSTRP